VNHVAARSRELLHYRKMRCSCDDSVATAKNCCCHTIATTKAGNAWK
jgi:hypothetical protein